MANFDQFSQWRKGHHQYAKEWKARTGGKVLGYFCTYVPEELVYAAGVLPVRILGSHEPLDVTEPYIFSMYCPFCRDCLAQGLKGRYDYLDGIMISQSCLHIRQTYNAWKHHIPIDYTYYLPMPHHVQSPAAVPYLEGELKLFQKSIEEWTGKKLAAKDIDHGIEVMNTNRRLMREVYELRKGDRVPVSGLDAMEMVVSSQMTDKAEHSRELEKVLKDIKASPDGKDTGIRLMIIGSEDDDTEFIKMVEALGSTFVTDDHCTGTRYFWNDVLPNKDRINAIAERYIHRTPCPTKDWEKRLRFEQIMQFAKEYRVQGAVLMQQKFCDPHELDIPPLKELLESNGIPTYFLEFDVTVPLGQFRIRIEAFLEMLRKEDMY